MIPYELVRSEQPALSFNGVRSPMIRKAIRIFEETLEDPVPMIDVARRLGISVRQMERGFKLALERTAFEVREELRVKRPRNFCRKRVCHCWKWLLRVASRIRAA